MKTLATFPLILGLFAGPPGISAPARSAASPVGVNGSSQVQQERFLYVATIAQSASDLDFITVVGADSRRHDFGQIVNRIDMPNVGDELHHLGYSFDQNRLIVPDLFSNRIHIFRINGDGKSMKLKAVNEELVARSSHIIPHSERAIRQPHAVQPGRERSGQFHQHQEEEHRRAGRPTYDALRPEPSGLEPGEH